MKYHVAATADITNNDPTKFDMTRPNKGTLAYRRVLEVYPLSHRVVLDVDNVFVYL